MKAIKKHRLKACATQGIAILRAIKKKGAY
jgi:hypothetical protein